MFINQLFIVNRKYSIGCCRNFCNSFRNHCCFINGILLRLPTGQNKQIYRGSALKGNPYSSQRVIKLSVTSNISNFLLNRSKYSEYIYYSYCCDMLLLGVFEMLCNWQIQDKRIHKIHRKPVRASRIFRANKYCVYLIKI